MSKNLIADFTDFADLLICDLTDFADNVDLNHVLPIELPKV